VEEGTLNAGADDELSGGCLGGQSYQTSNFVSHNSISILHDRSVLLFTVVQ
jgi:hypothetical protein